MRLFLLSVLISCTALLQAQWSEVFETNTLFGLTDVSAATDDVAWACMPTDSIYKTTDGGDSWERIGLPALADDYQINNIYALNSNIAFLCGSIIYTGTGPGIVYRTNDGGTTWENVFEAYGNCTFTLYFKNDLEGIMIVFSSDLFGVSDAYIRKTNDGGITWTDDDTGLPTATFFGLDNDNLFGKINELWLSDIDGGLHYSDDFGESWEMIYVPEISDVVRIPAFENTNYGFAGGTEGFLPKLLKTTDGATFSPVTDVLSFTIENVVAQENEIWYTINPGVDITVYYSSDGGENFDPQFSNPTGIKEMTASRNGNNLWALNSAGEGKIYRYLNATEYTGEPLFDVSELSICPGNCVSYTDLSNNEPVAWHWMFEGATPSESFEENPSPVCYDEAGNYSVALITTNADGISDTLSFDDYITVIATPADPELTLSGTTISCAALGGETIEWYLNGELIPGADEFTLDITESGNYSVVVNYFSGCSGSATIEINTAQFASSDTSVCAGYCINFTDQSINSPTSWLWFFEGADITSSTNQNPEGICYSDPGIFDVELITTNASGTDTAFYLNYVTVAENPEMPVISVVGSNLSVPDIYSTYQWYFEGAIIDGATSNAITATDEGIYLVVVTNESGCASQNSVEYHFNAINQSDFQNGIDVYPNPAGDFVCISIPDAKDLSVLIYDANSKVICKSNSTGNFLYVDTHGWLSGVYFIEIRTETFHAGKIFTVK